METLMPWTQVARPGPDLSGQRAARGLAAHASGHSAERRVAAEYEGRGCVVLESCWRSAAGEVDLILRDRDGTLVFVEVRARADASHGGAAASVTVHKQQRLIYAAQHYLQRHATPPPCRFDVVALDGDTLTWLPGAFDVE